MTEDGPGLQRTYMHAVIMFQKLDRKSNQMTVKEANKPNNKDFYSYIYILPRLQQHEYDHIKDKILRYLTLRTGLSIKRRKGGGEKFILFCGIKVFQL